MRGSPKPWPAESSRRSSACEAPERPTGLRPVGPAFLPKRYLAFSPAHERCLSILFMEYESWPMDPVAVASLVAQLIDEIDAREEADTRVLLEMFLTAAWGCRSALDQ